MIKFFHRSIFYFLLATIFIVGLTNKIIAGGGNYSPVNFYSGDVVSGKSIDIVVKVYDWGTPRDQAQYTDEHGSPVLYGEEFKFHAHANLEGAICNTTQSKSDTNGYIKANCSANTTGRLVFHIEPLTRRDMGDSPEYNVYFSSSSNVSSDDKDENSVNNELDSVVSAAAGPCQSGRQSLAYYYPNQCERGSNIEAIVKCNNGFAAKIYHNQCTAGTDNSWTNVNKMICDYWACTSDQQLAMKNYIESETQFKLQFLNSKTITKKTVVETTPVIIKVASPSPTASASAEIIEKELDGDLENIDEIEDAQVTLGDKEKNKIILFVVIIIGIASVGIGSTGYLWMKTRKVNIKKSKLLIKIKNKIKNLVSVDQS